MRLTLGGLIAGQTISVSRDSRGSFYRSTTAIMSESEIYRMLLQGHAPQSEPFRRWVTEEVLPTIRKTGSYDAAKSDHPVAQGVLDELKALLCRFCGLGRAMTLRISSSNVDLIA
jgi:prophage antirepressor-like protein